MKKLFSKLKNIRKRYVVAIVAALAVAIPAAAIAGYGPSRPTFDWNNPADRKGSMTGPVFNSFINTPQYGNEQAFVDAKDATNTNPGGFKDTVDVQAGKEYTIRAYVHNNANPETNPGVGTAKNTRVRFNVLPGVANGNEVTGYISADNSAPKIVYDTVKLKNDAQAFSLEYVPGSARIENNAHPFPGVALPDSITSAQGAQIGYDQMNGSFPGCFEFTAIVTIKVRVKAPELQLSKGVSNAEAPKKADLKENIVANPGDTITWRIDYVNNGTDVARDITVRDSIPKGLTLVPGSITWFDVNHPNGETMQNTALGSGGVNVGNYAPKGNGAIRFRTTIDKDVREKKLCEIKNVAYAHAQNIPEISDGATVTIKDCNQVKPVYSCDLLDATKIGDKSYRFNVNATASNGAQIVNYSYDFGDGTAPHVTDQTTVEHTYANNGNFVAKVTVNVRVDGKIVQATSPACMKPINVNVPPENCPIPGKENLPKDSPECVTPVVPGELPNTGAGDVAAIFAAVSVAAMAAYRVFMTRRLNG